MLQERRQFNLVNVLVMRRHRDLKYLTQLKILSTIEKDSYTIGQETFVFPEETIF